MQEMSVTYSQLDREARKAAKLAQCAAERAAFLAALTESVLYYRYYPSQNQSRFRSENQYRYM